MSCANGNNACSDGDVQLEDKSLNGTHRLRFPLEKDGLPWTGIDSVVYTFYPPTGTPFTRNAVLEEPDAGVWYYDTVSTDLTETGYWSLDIEVTDGTVVLEYPHDIQFRVRD